ncbi:MULTISPECIES: ABC transporter ATP-binding protein [Cupriavidus]|uniref:Oligopeptide/dipeptide ABC transporter, ATP-binding protein, C-terminal n=1 Tax=Cupriavidus pinatubonensis (strain JMP 134 / LMG 1197) TaxID=264198 RepID=Q472R9_CUPPJ|nr:MULTISPECIES: ABC transporter ATP-binding protein [Cupriavidus]QYY32812.1 ABC transporter ATP-binding protein [Cupriavidus pinatubonensis]
MALLEVNGLTTRFALEHGAVTAVDNVSFSLNAGEILGIVGESGSGKSVTAFSLMNLLDPPGRVTGGTVRFKGQDLRTCTPRQWQALRGDRIAMVFQDPMMSLNPVMRIGAQLIETVRVHHRCSHTEAHDRAVDALKKVGIPAPQERMQAYPHELSGGMRQRVAIANALINQPDLIIADEPTTALDVTIQAQILFEMKQLVRETGAAVIWISHDLAVVKDLVDRVCVMYAGRVVEQGPVADVIRQPMHPYTRGLLDSLPAHETRGRTLRAIPGAAPALYGLPPGCAFAPRCTRASESCAQAPLEVSVRGRSLRCVHPLEAA